MTTSYDKVGISCFLTKSPGFSGKLKQHPEDFVVREIGPKAEIATITTTEIPAREENIQPTETTNPSKRKREPITLEEPSKGWKEYLKEQIGSGGLDLLEAIAASRMLESPRTDVVTFAASSDTMERSMLHRSIQEAFACLQTKTNKQAPGTNSETTKFDVQVFLDPLYLKLRKYSVMTHVMCDKVLDYLRRGRTDPKANEGVFLLETEDKQVRTQLHQAIFKTIPSLCTRTVKATSSSAQKIVASFTQNASRSKKLWKKRNPDYVTTYTRFVLKKYEMEHFKCFSKLAKHFNTSPGVFSVAGIKDKVAVTYQYVTAKNIHPVKALTINDIDGLSAGNFSYVTSPLLLGESEGNQFDIVVRNANCSSFVIEKAIASVQESGFINYFGVQRVGLPSEEVRPHHLGLAILKEQWSEFIDLLFQPKPFDSEDLIAAKNYYLVERNIEASLKKLPLRFATLRGILQILKRAGKDAHEHAIAAVPYSMRLFYLHAYQSLLFNRLVTFKISSYGIAPVAGDLVLIPGGGKAVRRITKGELEALNEYEASVLMKNIVLPLPGSGSEFPDYDIQEKVVELLKEDGLTIERFRHRAKKIGLRGSYRKVIVFPTNMSWQITGQLGDATPDSVAWDNTGEMNVHADALRVKFCLPPGSFATVCLREIMKHDI